MHFKNLIILFSLLLTQFAIAQNRSYNVYVDRDNNVATGCTVLQPNFMTQFDGVDGYISVEIGSAPVAITSSLYFECQGGSFDAGSAIVTSALGFNTNVNGDDVFEMQMNTFDLGIRSSTAAKLYYSAESDASSDIVVVNNNGGDILLGVAFPIPVLSFTALLLLSLIIILIVRKTLKNKPIIFASILLFSSVVWGMFTFIIDGDVNDWNSLTAINDPIGDNSSPSNSSDITQVFGNLEQDLFTARIDVVDVENQPPTIVSPATASAIENQTTVIDVQSTDPNGDVEGMGLTYGLTGTIDDALFSIDLNSGVIAFLAAPDFEIPGDFDGDNNYEIEVTVTDSGGLTDVQNIVVTVTNDVNDDANVEFSLALSNTVDEATPLNVVVVLNALAPLTAPLSIDVVDATGGTATTVTDYDAIGTQTVTFPTGAVDGDTMNVVLTPVNDINVENNETVNLLIQNISGPGFIGAQATHTVTIIEDDVVTIDFNLAASSTTDESTPLDVVIQLNIPSGGQLDVAVTGDVIDALSGSATSAIDYNALITQTLTFAIGAADGDTQNVTLTPIDDSDMEGDETVDLIVQNVAGAPTASVGAQSTHTATITDDDASVEFQTLLSSTVDEATPLNVVVVLSTPSALTAPLSVDFVETVGGTATTVTDYTAIGTQTITFPIGATNGTTLNGVLTPVNDINVENNETVNLQLQNVVGLGALGTQITHTATITEDDVVTVEFLTISSATVNESTALDIMVQLNIPGGGQLDVAVTADTIDALSGSATNANDYVVFGTQMVSFAIGSLNGATQNVTLTPIDDTAVEGNETVDLVVQNVAGVPTASLGGQALHTVVITDDEAIVAFQNAMSSTNENSLGLFQVVELTTPIPLLANLSVDVVDLGSGSATSGSDFVARGVQTVTFLAGSTNGATMTTPMVLQPIDDNNVENNETINLQLQNIVGTGLYGSQSTHELTIVSDDAATIEFVTAASATVDESTALNVVVSLTIPNSGELDVVLTADVVDAGGGSATSAVDYSAFGIQPVVFGIGTMSGATINTTLTPLDDMDPEGAETVNLAVQNISGALLASVGVQGSHIATITDDDNTPPTAVNDAYNVTGNVGLTVPAAAGVLLNDIDAETAPLALTVTAFDAASAQGGVVSVANDGSFTYSPPAGYTGVDSFTYEISDGALPAAAAATVNLTIANKIWFIDNSAAAGDGALATPFNTIAAFNAVNNNMGFNPSDGECIFIDETGGGDYIGPMVLLNNQIVVGKGTTVAISTTCGVALATHSSPLPTINGIHPLLTSAGVGINIAVGNNLILRGFDIGNATTKLKGGSIGTLTIDDMALLGTGESIDIIGGNADIVFDSISSTNSTEHGIYLHTITGTFAVTGLTYIDNATLPSIVIQNSTMNYMFGDVIIQRRNSTGVSISASGAVQSGLFNVLIVNNQNNSSTNALVINDSGNGGLVTVGNIIVDGNNIGNSSGLTLFNNAGNVDINTGGIEGSFNSPAINIVGGTGDLNYGGSVNNTAGPSVNVENLTGGVITFSGSTITDTGTGINLENNTGATIDFSSVININKASSISPAFNATGGGTVSATGVGSTLTASSGVAINIENTTIGAGNLIFQSATSNASAQHIGINLDTTGASGSLMITGDGVTPGSGGTIANKTGADGSNTQGIGIYLNNTQNPSFSYMQLNDFENFAIKGDNVTGFSLINSVIDGVNGTSTGLDEGSISFDNLFGSAVITSSSISGGFEDNIKIENNLGELNRLTVSNSTIGLNSTASGNDGILIESQAGAIANISVLNNSFLGSRGDMVQCNAIDLSIMDCVIRDNTFNNTHPSSLGGGVTISGGGLGSNIIMTYDVSSFAGTQTFNGAVGSAITANFISGTGLINGAIDGNVIGTSGVLNSGSSSGDGILVGATGNQAHTALVQNNVIRRVSGFAGIDILSNIDNPTELRATIINNFVSELDGFTFAGLYAIIGGGTGMETGTTCLDIRSNNFDATAVAGFGMAFDQISPASNYNLPQYAGAPNAATADIGMYLDARMNVSIPTIDASPVLGVTGIGVDCL